MKLSNLVVVFATLLLNGETHGDAYEVKMKMPEVHPDEDDSYICTSFKLSPEDSYIVKYEPNAHKETAHHMLLFGCDKPGGHQKSWNCGNMGAGTCAGSESILFGWAKDAPALELPKDVGFKVGGQSKIKYLVLQIHYAKALKSGQYDSSGLTVHMTTMRQPNIASIYLIMASFGDIPPHRKGVHIDVACKYESDQEIHAFAFRTHAHDLARVITGYRVRDNNWKLLGKGDPHAPQAFYPMKNVTTIKKGDILAGRCTYDTYNTARTKVTSMGATANDEMCNFYMMYYRDAHSKTETPELCADQFTYERLSPSFPKDSDVALKSSPNAHHHHHHQNSQDDESQTDPSNNEPREEEPGTSDPLEPGRVTTDDSHVYNPDNSESPTTGHVTTADVMKSKTDAPSTNPSRKTHPPTSVQNQDNTNHDVTTDVTTSTSVSEQTTSASKFTVKPTSSDQGREGNGNSVEVTTGRPTAGKPQTTVAQHVLVGTELNGLNITNEDHGHHPSSSRKNLNNVMEKVSVVDKWPSDSVAKKLGQVTGLAVDSAGRVIVFHRGGRAWDIDTFNKDNTFREPKKRGTIKEATILILDRMSGKILEEWGKHIFYLPHGLTVDHEDNVWITDVGRHQVMKFQRKQLHKPSLTLGQELVPGSDDKHFCKPTDVAVEESGVFYVADGYCNGRIMKFSSEGALLKKWGKTSLNQGLTARPSTFYVPHSLALDKKRGMLYVADRENGRIQCFDKDGKFHKQISSELFGGRVFAVDYNDQDNVLYAVNGPGQTKVQGFTIQPNTGKMLATWSPHDKGFTQPHAVISRGSEIYVGEIGPNKVWKMETEHKDDAKGNNYVRGLDHTTAVQPTSDSDTNDSHPQTKAKQSNRPAVVILSILGVPVVILLIVGVVSKVRGREKLPKYDMMDEGLGNPSSPRSWCVSVNCCSKPYNSMEELYLMDSDSDLEIFPDVHVNKR